VGIFLDASGVAEVGAARWPILTFVATVELGSDDEGAA
jgi:hypothetical protein